LLFYFINQTGRTEKNDYSNGPYKQDTKSLDDEAALQEAECFCLQRNTDLGT
jgi:hypothetical protein